jgi:hypothetical protein
MGRRCRREPGAPPAPSRQVHPPVCPLVRRSVRLSACPHVRARGRRRGSDVRGAPPPLPTRSRDVTAARATGRGGEGRKGGRTPTGYCPLLASVPPSEGWAGRWGRRSSGGRKGPLRLRITQRPWKAGSPLRGVPPPPAPSILRWCARGAGLGSAGCPWGLLGACRAIGVSAALLSSCPPFTGTPPCALA